MQKGIFLQDLVTKLGTVNNAIITLGDIDDSGKGRKFVSKFIQPGLVKIEGHGIVLLKKETLDASLPTIVGSPVIIQHKDVTEENADELRCGVIANAYFNEPDGWYYVDGIIWDDKAQELISNGWSVSCSYDYLAFNDEGGDENNIHYDKEFTQLNFTHLAIVDNPRYERANIVFNSKTEVKNGFITLDAGTEKERVIWIPENVHYVKPSERKRVFEICDAYKEGAEPKYDFSHTRVKPTEEQIKYLKDTVKGINDEYAYKGIAQIEISSSLNNGSWGVCFAPNNTSLISIAPSMYKENAQKKYDASVESGFHPKGTGEAIKSVLVHEIGHAITCNSKDEKFWGKIDTIRSEYLKTIGKDDINNPDFISNYARENRYEFVAEAFCQGHLSKKYGKYTKQVMDLMKEHFSKTHQTKLFNSKDEEQEMWIEGFGFGYPINEEEYEKFREDLKDEKEKAEKNKANNSKEQDMAIIEELKKLIFKIENNKENETMVENEKVDKRKLIDEVAGIMKSAGCDDEDIRTAIGKMEKIGYDDSEASADNKKVKNEADEEGKKVDNEEDKKDEDKDKKEDKVDNESEEDKEKVEDLKKEEKKDIDNKCKNSKEESYFDKLNKIYNSAKKIESASVDYEDKQTRLDAGKEYFG